MKNTLFNHTIYINLKKRPERKKEALEELKKIGITKNLQTTHPIAIHLEAIEEENGVITKIDDSITDTNDSEVFESVTVSELSLN